MRIFLRLPLFVPSNLYANSFEMVYDPSGFDFPVNFFVFFWCVEWSGTDRGAGSVVRRRSRLREMSESDRADFGLHLQGSQRSSRLLRRNTPQSIPGSSELEPWASIRKMAVLKAIFVDLIDAHGRIDGKD